MPLAQDTETCLDLLALAFAHGTVVCKLRNGIPNMDTPMLAPNVSFEHKPEFELASAF